MPGLYYTARLGWVKLVFNSATNQILFTGKRILFSVIIALASAIIKLWAWILLLLIIALGRYY